MHLPSSAEYCVEVWIYHHHMVSRMHGYVVVDVRIVLSGNDNRNLIDQAESFEWKKQLQFECGGIILLIFTRFHEAALLF